jgi:hypothetical protein
MTLGLALSQSLFFQGQGGASTNGFGTRSYPVRMPPSPPGAVSNR